MTKTQKDPQAETKITKKADGTVSFTLTIPAATVATEYAHVMDEYVRSAEIKGFRKGKAPRSLVEASVDQNKVINHILDHTIPPAYSRILIDEKLNPLVDPQIVPQKMDKDQDWAFTVTTAVAPEVELGEYQTAVKKALADHKAAHAKAAKAEKTAPAHDEEEHETSAIFDALLATAKVDVAQLLVDAETKSALSRLVNQLASLKLKVEDYAKSIKKTTDELVKEYQETAKTNLKLEFILQKLIDAEKPEETEAEIAELKPGKGQEAYAKYVLQKRKVLDILRKL